MASNNRERSPWSDAVADTVVGERNAARLTQKDMVERTGLSRSTYVRIEAGTHVTDATELAKICSVLNLGLGEFFHRVERRIANGNEGSTEA